MIMIMIMTVIMTVITAVDKFMTMRMPVTCIVRMFVETMPVIFRMRMTVTGMRVQIGNMALMIMTTMTMLHDR